MKKAADEMKRAHGSEIAVSCDGTWQRRRFSSKNGDVTVTSVNGLSSKTIDTKLPLVLSAKCGPCMENKSCWICLCHRNRKCEEVFQQVQKVV